VLARFGYQILRRSTLLKTAREVNKGHMPRLRWWRLMAGVTWTVINMSNISYYVASKNAIFLPRYCSMTPSTTNSQKEDMKNLIVGDK
jgi:hypothetical protein